MARHSIDDDFRRDVVRWMEHSGYTQIEAAAIIGTSQTTLNNIIRGRSSRVATEVYTKLSGVINECSLEETQVAALTPTLREEYSVETTQEDIGFIKRYKSRHSLSYDQMAERFKVPIVDLVTILESPDPIILKGSSIGTLMTVGTAISRELEKQAFGDD